MDTPTNGDILALLDQLDSCAADDLESKRLDFKPWQGPKDDMRVAVEYAVCFANAEGGVVVFGVADKVVGRTAAIHGAQRYDLDVWRRGIYSETVPSLEVEVEELPVPEGTGKLLIVRVPKGNTPPYGTKGGLYKIRIGKNCMPLAPDQFARLQIASGAIDWSAQPAEGVRIEDLDPVEISRGRSILKSKNPEAGLLALPDGEFLEGLGAVRGGKVTNAGLLLFGRPKTLTHGCPQNCVHYAHQISDTEVARNDQMRAGLLNILNHVELFFTGPSNPEEELSIGFFKLRIPAFPLTVVREAVLNAVTHRDYSSPQEILIRQTKHELVVTNPGGFAGGITPDNILRHEPFARNRTLADALLKLHLVESVGIGRQRIFKTLLEYGKQVPRYESDEFQVTLRIFNGSYDANMATLAAKWRETGREVDLDGLLILSYLKEHPFLDAKSASRLLQLPFERARDVLDRLSHRQGGFLERKGHTKAATFHLNKGVARDLLGKAAYTKVKGLNPVRYAEMVRTYVKDHEAITPGECRELLGLGDSQSARVEVSRYLKKWSGEQGFLRVEGTRPKNRYVLKIDYKSSP